MYSVFVLVYFTRRKSYMDQFISCSSNMFVCVEVLRPCQPNGAMSSVVSLPYHTFIGQA